MYFGGPYGTSSWRSPQLRSSHPGAVPRTLRRVSRPGVALPPAPNIVAPAAGFVVILLGVLWVGAQDGMNLLAHSQYDSYTLQALAWRSGQIPLAENRPWLELAVFRGDYYVSFPPIPAIPMLLLSYVFGENTPSGAATLLYFFGGLAALYALLRRYLAAGPASVWLVLIGLGGTLPSLAAPGEGAVGGVWFQAQLLAFFLTALAFLLVDGDRRLGWGIGLACLALAVGCRPFNILYAPVLLWILLGHLGGRKAALLPFLAAPAAIGGALALYNAVRFGNPTEFGHAYLPELTNAGEGMFVPSRIPEHLANVVRAPSFDAGELDFPAAGGFAFYLTNPLIVIGLGVALVRAIRRKVDVVDALLVAAIIVHALLLLSHRTNGGWQYGTRYLTDLVPALVFLIARGSVRMKAGAAVGAGGLIAFNLSALATFNAMT